MLPISTIITITSSHQPMLQIIDKHKFYDSYKINSNLKYQFNNNYLDKIIAVLNQSRQEMIKPLVRAYLHLHNQWF